MNLEGAKARLERYIREINAAQSKAIILKNDLSNDYELELFDELYVIALQYRDGNIGYGSELFEDDEREDFKCFTKLCDDVDNVIEANNQLLSRLYETKRLYAKEEQAIKRNTPRGGFVF